MSLYLEMRSLIHNQVKRTVHWREPASMGVLLKRGEDTQDAHKENKYCGTREAEIRVLHSQDKGHQGWLEPRNRQGGFSPRAVRRNLILPTP